MSGEDPRCVHRIGAALHARSEDGWDAMSSGVRRRVRSTARPGRLLAGTGSPRVPGNLTVREHALRALIARALRTDADCEPSMVEFDIDGQRLTAVRVGVRANRDSALHEIRNRARHVVSLVVRAVLGEAQHRMLSYSIDVDVTNDARPNSGGNQ